MAQVAQVGEGATLIFPQDKYPYVVTRVSASGKVAWVKRLQIVDTSTGHQPDYYLGPWPVWDHEYTKAELVSLAREDAREERIYRDKNGYWRMSGWDSKPLVALGRARYRRDYSD